MKQQPLDPEQRSETLQASKGQLPFGSLAYAMAGLSVLFCYAQVLLDLAASDNWESAPQIDPHAQAVLMWGSALIAVGGLWRDRKFHGANGPLVTGVFGTAVIAGTLYTHYDVFILIFGYLLLVAAVLMNPAKLLSRLNQSVTQQAKALTALNDSLEERVASQVTEIERLARLKSFLSDEVVNLITEDGQQDLLNSHRQVIACLFCDIRNFTGFSESVEPEDVMDVLQSLHQDIGLLVSDHGGSVGFRSGDGLMVIFNDPLPCDEPVLRAARLAISMNDTFENVKEHWAKLGHSLGLGIGIAYGYATLGQIGTEGRFDYTAIGNVVNIASRLCDRAEDHEILIDKRAAVEIENCAQLEGIGGLNLKGLEKPVETFRLSGLSLGESFFSSDEI